MNDTLTAWTDQIFAAPSKLRNFEKTKGIIASGNGYFLQFRENTGNRTIVGLQLVKYNYKFNNSYLPKGFSKKFSIPENTSFSLAKSEWNINGNDGKFLLSLSFENQNKESPLFMFLIFTLYVTSFLCIIAALFVAYLYVIRLYGHRYWLISLFVADVFILRAIQFYFQFPTSLYSLDIFSPVYFASSNWLPSLGDLIINILLLLQISYFIHKSVTSLKGKIDSSKWSILWVVVIFLLIIALFEILRLGFRDFVMNSNIPLQFEQLLSLTPYSFAGLLVVVSALLTFLFLSDALIHISRRLNVSTSWFWGSLILILIAYGVYVCRENAFNIILPAFPGLLITFLALRETSLLKGILKTGWIGGTLLLLSILATFLVNQYIREKEHGQREILASHLSDSRDKMAEYYYRLAARDIQEDSLIKQMILGPGSDTASEGDITGYIDKKYFQRLKSRYNILLTLCHPGKKLNVKPNNLITDCNTYFNQQINTYLQAVDSNSLYFMNQSVDYTYYLGKIRLAPDATDEAGNFTLFVELDSKTAGRGLGYPELLMDKSSISAENLSGYSYAYYYQNELVRNVGKFFYNTEYHNNRKVKYFNYSGYSHLVHPIDNKTTLLLSLEKPGLSDLVAPFSFIFFLLLILLVILMTVTGKMLKFRLQSASFRFRLQVFMVILTLTASILIGGVTIFYLNQLNYNKNKDIVSEKINTILVELENRFGKSDSFDNGNWDGLNDALLSLSNSNFTDINIYDTRGMLLASSRFEIFDEGLISEQMNPESFLRMKDERRSFFIHNESIGNYSFLSAYAPLRNVENHLIAYLNIPYFSRQEDLRMEMSKLMATYANIYLAMIALAVFLALIISRYITKPLLIIRDQLGSVRLGTTNTKLEWSGKDEIGELLNEYNRMIDELSVSAERLAKSERESAWREMARQVAHEIKNPLTPIKLSMQHLIKAWDDKAPDWETRLRKFSQTLIMQIDTLSAIATEFSDFAQMPASRFSQVDLISVIHGSSQLFKDLENIRFELPSTDHQVLIFADENQMLRVFNNLIKNAVQAIPPGKEGLITISLETTQKHCLITFRDNGSGIPNEQQTRIFSPNFTTKSAGMGLGLAMVKNIIDSSGGRIWFESVADEGTSFYLQLPLEPNS
ncbi:MAG: GHKL domain-containing protein [Bacteroidales bacterium]|nr:GHKL domain-containing protein [Bacteroidales bacterium]